MLSYYYFDSNASLVELKAYVSANHPALSERVKDLRLYDAMVAICNEFEIKPPNEGDLIDHDVERILAAIIACDTISKEAK